MSGEANKIHMANSNSSEPNVRVGVEEVSKWKTGEMDSVKDSAHKKSSMAGLSPIEEGRKMETSSLLVEADVSLDTTGV